MYIYFNVDETLKEIVQTPVRQGSVAHNKIYIYVEPEIGQPVGNVYHLPAAYNHAKIDFAAVDEDLNLNPNGGNSVIMTKVTNIEIPYDDKRDLYFFKYGYKYEMWMVELPTSVTSYTGKVKATAYIYNDNEQIALNTFAFNVETSVGVILDSTMTQSQYSYLLNLISYMVPYSGANDNLDLGSNELQFNDSYIYEDEDHDLIIGTGVGKIVLAPETYVEYNGYEIATKNDLPKKNVIGTFNTSSFLGYDDIKQCVVTLSGFIANGDLLVITWGGCFAICPIPQSGPGRVCAALWNGNGEAQITRIRYELIDANTKLRLTLPSSFSLPSNFTGYVIEYKIA